MNDSDAPILELPVPKFKRVVIGAIMLAAFILFFVLLAIYNLCNFTGIIPSTIWLLLVGIVLGGWKKFTTDILGTFSRKEFIRAIRRDDGKTDFEYGFRLFGRWFSYFTVAVGKIETVKWNTGQASHFAGRELDDWSVAIWYDHDDPVKSQNALSFKKPDQDLYIIGMSGAKAETAALGQSVLNLLRKSGATFTQGENDCAFVRQSIPVA